MRHYNIGSKNEKRCAAVTKIKKKKIYKKLFLRHIVDIRDV